jgi:hypothetical protein
MNEISARLYQRKLRITPEATIYACVDYHVKPAKPFEVSFTAGGSGYDQCMKRTGTSTTATVKSKGLTCASLGEVESDNEGWCYWKKSYWAASYSANGIVGSMGSRWQDETEENSWITLQDSSPHTNVCMSKAHCGYTKLRWDYERKPDVYVSLLF